MTRGWRTPRTSPTGAAIAALTVGWLLLGAPALNGSPRIGTPGATPIRPDAAIPPAALEYSISFTEHGLPVGSPWHLSIAGGLWNSSNTTIVVQEPDGQYAYEASATLYGRTWYQDGTVNVAGGPARVDLDFTGNATAPGAPPGSAGSASSAGGGPTSSAVLIVGITLLAVLGIGGTVLVSRYRSSRRAPPHPPAPELAPKGGDKGSEHPPMEEDPLGHML